MSRNAGVIDVILDVVLHASSPAPHFFLQHFSITVVISSAVLPLQNLEDLSDLYVCTVRGFRASWLMTCSE